MAIRSRKNQYAGINAHLNSWLQNMPGEWESFHASHIVDITRVLNQYLPEGYEARVEKSLQVREVYLTEEGVQEKRRLPQPDITVVDLERTRNRSNLPASLSATAEFVTPVIDTMDIEPDALLNAAIIYRIEEGDVIGRPITRIELLSPANKPPAEGYKKYREKRNSTLSSGMPLVEIDYLHQTTPVAKNLPSYADGEPKAHAYNIIVNDPRPSVQSGLSHVHAFDVDAPICCLDIPLDHHQLVEQFDFGIPYNVTYENTPTYLRVVEYEQEPLRFDLYSPDDQTRIHRRMSAIYDAVQNGVNLDDAAPLPLHDS
jgi:hypothetical protein